MRRDAADVARIQLWSDEIEALRSEARAAVDSGRDTLALGEPTPEGATREQMLTGLRQSMDAVTFPLADAEVREIAGVPCRIFRPDGPVRAVYLHFHGGGMVSGTPAVMDIPNSKLSKNFGVAVVSSDYRKAPEHPWPAGPDDGTAVARWLLQHSEQEFGCSSMLIGGESAGAYMAAIVALRIRDELQAIDRVQGLNLLFGVFDWGRSPSQRGRRPQDGFDVLSPEATSLISDCFLPGLTDDQRRAPEISPAFADLRGFPPCFVTVGTCDHLFDDSLMLANRAAAAGVEVELFVAPEMPHAFIMFDCGITKLWSQRQELWLREHVPGQ